ncbi:LacI family DNA-binding transcriptional regulator [Penaeicola halotolerans]|uniref:LacI family DNA-binding transcriptional regulator n=1 Tax=Penaeicola halotolerans TaxID=2793196 RepID=UPI001CF927BE|nr:LacI family DNA-binding transcriptional regulator [Penaeicola halotolerans]
MKIGQATIKDIAKALNVSSSTVSRALKDYPGISDETKKAVKELAKKMNYRPNAVALSLRKSKSNTIGVIIPEIVHFFFSTVISGIEEVAFKEGYNVILSQTNESYNREINSVNTLLASQVDGLLVSFTKETNDFEHFNDLLERNFPIVFFDRISEKINATSVIVNDFSGAYKATEHLIQQGDTKIVHLAGPSNLLISKKRLEGYLAALRDNGIPIDDQLIIECPKGTQEESYLTMLDFMRKRQDITGIFASNDLAASGAMKAAQELGKQVPSEIGIVGFSNWQFSSLINPPLSTVEQSGFKIGETAAKLLIDQINFMNEHPVYPFTEIMDATLLVRASSLKK